MWKFKNDHKEEYRLNESKRIKLKFPDRIPIICEKKSSSKDTPDIDKSKFLVPLDLTIGQFLLVIRNKMKLPPEKSIYMFVDDKIVSGTQTISYLYEYNRDPDGFLYIGYTSENTFG